jgi:hypothetical protein
MDFAASYRYQSGVEYLNVPLAELKLADHEEMEFVRRSWTTRQQHHTPGYFFFSTTGQLVYHESYLERQILLIEDFKKSASFVVDQPFKLRFGERWHVPDFLILSPQGHTLLDVRHSKYVQDDKFVASTQAMSEAAAQLGWRYDVRTEPHPQFLMNLDWLSGFRRKPPDVDLFSEQIIHLFANGPQTFRSVFKCLNHELFSKPVVFYLLWQRILEADLHAPSSSDTVVDLCQEIST